MTAESSDNRVVLVTGAVALGAAAALLGAWLIGAFDAAPLAGDEPPIRVRNGSIELQLLHPSHKYEEADGSTDKKNWRIETEPPRHSNDVTVLVLPSNFSSCPGGFVASGNKVEFFYNTGKKITVQSNGSKRIRVKGDDALDNPSGNRQLLRYDVAGVYIQRIDIGSHAKFCEFSAADSNLQVVVLD